LLRIRLPLRCIHQRFVPRRGQPSQHTHLLNRLRTGAMVFFLVDLEFREKAKNLLTSRELAACIVFLLFALIPWVEVYDYWNNLSNSTWLAEGPAADGMPSTNCNPHSRACL